MVEMKFNGISKSFFKILKEETRPISPEIKRSVFTNANRHGYRVGKMLFGARAWQEPFIIYSKDFEDLQKKKEEIAEWLIHQDAKELIFSDEADRVYLARIDGINPQEESAFYLKGIMTIICHDPFKYAIVHEKITGLQIDNKGKIETPCIINVNFTAAANEFRVRNTTSNKEARIIWNFIRNDRLEIDMSRRKILINGHLRMTSFDFRSQMFSIMPGRNVLTSNVAAANIETTFRERWK